MGIGGLAVKLFKNTFIRTGALPKAGVAAESAVGNAVGKAAVKPPANAVVQPRPAPQGPKSNPAVQNISDRTKNILTQAEMPKPKIVRMIGDISVFDGGKTIPLGKMMASLSDHVLQRLKGPDCSDETRGMVVKLLNKYRASGNPIETEIMQGTALLGRLRVEGRIAFLRIGNFAMQGEVTANNIVFNLLDIR